MKAFRFARTFGRMALILAPAALVVASAAESDKAAATKGIVKRSDVEIVDCLLPGQVRQLGNSTFLSQRRPIRTTTAECTIRGGEYVAYDRADIKQALRIWMETAQGGDPEAQTNVGEIYERGMGVPPDYAHGRAVVPEGRGQGLLRARCSTWARCTSRASAWSRISSRRSICIDRPGASRRTTSSSRPPRSASRMSCASSSKKRSRRRTRSSACCRSS